jgi:hypothetical protein
MLPGFTTSMPAKITGRIEVRPLSEDCLRRRLAAKKLLHLVLPTARPR